LGPSTDTVRGHGGDFDQDPRQSVDAVARTERTFIAIALSVRMLHLVQGAIALLSGWRSYRRPRLAVLMWLAAVAESLWIARVSWRRQSFAEPSIAVAEATAGVVGLVALSSATEPEGRTSWVNWMTTFTMGTSGISGAALPPGQGVAMTGLLAGTYVKTVWGNLKAGGSQAAAGLGNATGYFAYTVCTRTLIEGLRQSAREVTEARQEAVTRGSRLAAEEERNRQHRLLHDSALQTLEAVARNWDLGEGTVRARAASEAFDLRRALAGDAPSSSGLLSDLGRITEEFNHRGLQVQLISEDALDSTDSESTRALTDAVREALANVYKHAETRDAVVRVAVQDGELTVVVRDYGVGFDRRELHSGYGIRQSIVARIEEAGGDAELWSAPGEGTRIRLAVPVSPTAHVADDLVVGPDRPDSFESSDAGAQARRTLLTTIFTMRTFHLVQGGICLISGWRSYRRPRLAAVTWLIVVAETLWMARVSWRRQSLAEPEVAVAEAGAGVMGLLALASATENEERTSWVNWMYPLTLGTSVAGASLPESRGLATTGLLAGTYLSTIWGSLRAGGSQRVTGGANAVGYLGYFFAARALVKRLQQSAREVTEARQVAVKRGRRLAAEEERNRQHRLLHSSALKTLELVAGSWDLEEGSIRARAGNEAIRLRRALTGDAPPSGLSSDLEGLAQEFVGRGLRVELISEDVQETPDSEVALALTEAVTEALLNVSEHAETTNVVVRVSVQDNEFTVVVRDHGVGFSTRELPSGSGIRRSIVARIEEVGGRVELWSEPGRGTRLRLTVPMAARPHREGHR
jgi:signal transduction histidine kinase